MNNLDKQYTDLLQDILDNGTTKQDRTGTGTLSVFGRQIRHKMSEGFPLLTTKKMPFKTITTELLWFLRGDTNIKYLVDNGVHIWDGDAYKNYCKSFENQSTIEQYSFDTDPMTKEMFISKIKTDADFAKKWGDLGPIYGKQWRSWYTRELKFRSDVVGEPQSLPEFFEVKVPIDQIANLINDIKTNPDSRRLMVSAWNVGELDKMTLPPCHYGFQVYTRELSSVERFEKWWAEYFKTPVDYIHSTYAIDIWEKEHSKLYPARAISLMWNQRSVDTFLGLPFNIASYGLLLEIIAKEVNMVPDELIGNLGDTHLYLNHIEQAKEQIGRELSLDERYNLLTKQMTKLRAIIDEDYIKYNIPTQTREPFPLPKLNIKLHFNNEPSFVPEQWLVDDFEIVNYQSHPTIKAPLSN